MPRVENGAVAFQAVFAAFCFAMGALLSSIGRGQENGAGNIGLQLDAGTCAYTTNNTGRKTIGFEDKGSGDYDPGFLDCRFQADRFNDAGIRETWNLRNNANGIIISGHFFAVLGWFFCIPPISALAAIFDQSGSTVSPGSTIVFAWVFAAALTLVEFVSEIGTSQTTEWITSSWGVLASPPDNALANPARRGTISAAQSLEMAYLIVQSRSLWLFAMDDIFIAVALGCAAKLTHASKEAPRELGLLAGAIVFFSVLDFIFEVTRFVNWRGSSNMVIVTTLFIDMILLPAWLIRLAFWLRNDDVAGVMNEAMDHAKSAAASAAPVLAATRSNGMPWVDSLEVALLKRGYSTGAAAYARLLAVNLQEQTLAVVPITLLLILTIAIFFGRAPNAPGELVGGMLCAIVGLTLFTDSLRICVMPLAELIGRETPRKLPQAATLFIAMCLGILCTYAEPALASLRPLARLVERSKTPYLYIVLNDFLEPLIFSIGLGVGVAAIVGILRFQNNWNMKKVILATITPCLICSCYMQWGNPELKPILGLAWDCGAVTTGPVSVPVLLALGIGAMKTSKEKRLASLMLQQAVLGGGQQPALDGFGIVTLASLFPVLAVQLLGIVLSFIYTHDDIVNRPEAAVAEDSPDEISPLREVVFAVRAILPLNFAMVFLVLFIIREPIPHLSIYPVVDIAPAKREDAGGDTSSSAAATPVVAAEDADTRALNKKVQLPPLSRQPSRHSITICDAEVQAALEKPGTSEEGGEVEPPTEMPGPSAGSAGGQESSASAAAAASSSTAPLSPDDSSLAPPNGKPAQSSWANAGPLLFGIFMGQIGMVLFNLGLTYGFTAIG